jgi:hypothetical protein
VVDPASHLATAGGIDLPAWLLVAADLVAEQRDLRLRRAVQFLSFSQSQ